MNLAAMEEFVNRLIDRRLARIDRAATVSSVNVDGTVNLDLGGGVIAPTQPAAASYSPRAAGDIVLVRNRGGEMFTLAKVGGPTSAIAALPVDVLSDSAAPAGWDAIVTGSVWGRNGANGVELWVKRIVAAPPTVGGTVTVTANRYTTYRAGSITQTDRAEEGDYTGRGLQTGLATFGSGAWSGLSGHTAGVGTLTVHRSASPHGFSYGEQTFYAFRVSATDPPLSTPTLITGAFSATAALNETVSFNVDAGWCQSFAAGTASAVGFYSDSALDNVEIDSVTLSIPWT